MIAGLRIVEDDLSGEEVIALLQLHLDELHALFPAESVHALPAAKLREPDVIFYAAWDGEQLAGCGALKQLDAAHGEIKSMRAASEYRGRGVGKAILLHQLAEARRRDYARVSLETGAIDALIPARRLYEAHGFVRCAPFGSYREDPLSVCMTRTL